MLTRHSGYVNHVEFASGAIPRILSASDDTTIRITTCDTCAPLDDLRRRAEQILSADEQATLQSVAAGQCYPQFSEHQKPVDCASRHRDEVFAVLPYPAPADAPLPAQLEAWASDECRGAYEKYRGVDYTADDEYYPWWTTPRSVEWDLGQRNAICVLTPRDLQYRMASARPSQ